MKPIVILILFFILSSASSSLFAQTPAKESEQLDFAQGLLARGMYDMAVLQCQKFISDYPQSASLQNAYMSLGEAYFLSQDFKKAMDAFNQFKQLFPNSDQLPMSILRLGQIQIQMKAYDEALKDLTSMDAQKQLKGELLQAFDFYIAKAYLGKTDTANALAYLQKAVGVDGAAAYTAFAYNEIGKIYSQDKKYDQSLDAYAKALNLAQDYALKGEITYRTSEVDFMSGKYNDAIKGFEQVLDVYPSVGYAVDALSNMLLSCFNLGRYEDLIAEYQKNAGKIKNDEADFPVHYCAVIAYIELKKFDQAKSLLDILSAMAGLTADEQLKIAAKQADILIRQQKYKEALTLLDARAPQNKKEDDEVLFLRAQAQFGLGNYGQAYGLYQNVYQNYPSSQYAAASLLGQAHSSQESGKFKESGDLFLKYYGLQGDAGLKSDALYDALIMAQKAGNIQQAISSALEYLKVFPKGDKYEKVLLILADSYGKNNQARDAVKLLQDYLTAAHPPEDADSLYFFLAYSQELLGQNDQALASYALVGGKKKDGKLYPAALKNMAIIYLSLKKPDLARACFDRLIGESDAELLGVDTYIWVCNEYLKALKYEDVLRVAAKAEKRFPAPDLLEINYFKAEALRGLGRCDEADKSYALVIASPSKNSFTGSAHIGYGLCLESVKKPDDAKLEFQKSLDENPDDFTITVHARFELARLLESQGKLNEALNLYQLIATIYDDDHFCSESLLESGKIFEQMKRREDAIKMYSEILDKYKNTPAADFAKGRVQLLK